MSEASALFQDVAERLFADACPLEVTAAAEAGEFPQDLWGALEDAGFLSMLLPESDGGAEASLADAGAILRAAGRHAAPGPILETILGRRLLADAGLAAPAGPLPIAFLGDGAPGPARARWGRAADLCLIVEQTSAGAALRFAEVACEGSDASFEPMDVITTAGATVAVAAGPAYEQALASAALLKSAQMLGAMDWCVERCLAFAGEREQFGKAIGGFQAIQHHLVVLAEESVAAAAIVGAALSAADDERLSLTAVARSRLGDAVDTARWFAHQTHGAIGFTREYPLNYRTRRLIAWRDDFGSTVFWRDRLAAQLIGAPAQDLWARMVQA